MAVFKSINPYNNELVGTHTSLDEFAVQKKLKLSEKAFLKWKNVTLQERLLLIENLVKVMEANLDENASLISLEMGKPLREAKAEIHKCIDLCRYYLKNADLYLRKEEINSPANKSYVRLDAMGIVLGIMPWNFPFWQVFRFAIPAIIGGNVAMLKHAPNVFGTAKNIENLFLEAGFNDGIFQNLIIAHEMVESILADARVCGLAFTGSERTGKIVAQLAGKHLKKSVLELGGSNAFMVFKDADIKKAARVGVKSRILNTGQSCIAAKRFIVHKDIYNDYLHAFIEELKQLNAGNPILPTTNFGVLARKDLADTLEKQVKTSLKAGAQLIFGGNRSDCFFEPSIVGNVRAGMPLFDEESFGPVASFSIANSDEAVFELGEQSNFGLGCTLFSSDVARAQELAAKSMQAAVFINEMVQSHPALPFGGTKNSGYGRELGKEGLFYFLNKKTVWVDL